MLTTAHFPCFILVQDEQLFSLSRLEHFPYNWDEPSLLSFFIPLSRSDQIEERKRRLKEVADKERKPEKEKSKAG
jgi:hypothetical protein